METNYVVSRAPQRRMAKKKGPRFGGYGEIRRRDSVPGQVLDWAESKLWRHWERLGVLVGSWTGYHKNRENMVSMQTIQP
jgi:hypothetical protein